MIWDKCVAKWHYQIMWNIRIDIVKTNFFFLIKVFHSKI